jgi:flagellar biosynthesis/type III secretory pathway protein FliH
VTYNNNNYHDAIYNAETEAEARAIALNELYKRTRKKVKAAGGMKTHQQAMEEILQEAKEEYSKVVEELAAFDPLIWEKLSIAYIYI